MKDNNPADNLAWRVIWRQLISSVGSQARMLRRSMLALLLAAFMHGQVTVTPSARMYPLQPVARWPMKAASPTTTKPNVMPTSLPNWNPPKPKW